MTEVIVGIGMRPGVERAAVLAAVREITGPSVLRGLATVDRRVAEPGLVAAAAELGVPIIGFTPAELAEIDVPNPSTHSMDTLGTPSVAEAAAIRAGGSLVTPKRSIGGVVVASASP